MDWKKKKGQWKAIEAKREYVVFEERNKYFVKIKEVDGTWHHAIDQGRSFENMTEAKEFCERIFRECQKADMARIQTHLNRIDRCNQISKIKKDIVADLGESTMKMYEIWRKASISERFQLEILLTQRMPNNRKELLSLFQTMKEFNL